MVEALELVGRLIVYDELTWRIRVYATSKILCVFVGGGYKKREKGGRG